MWVFVFAVHRKLVTVNGITVGLQLTGCLLGLMQIQKEGLRICLLICNWLTPSTAAPPCWAQFQLEAEHQGTAVRTATGRGDVQVLLQLQRGQARNLSPPSALASLKACWWGVRNALGQITGGHSAMRPGQPGEPLWSLNPAAGNCGGPAVTVCSLRVATGVQRAGDCEELATLGKGGWVLIHSYEALTRKAEPMPQSPEVYIVNNVPIFCCIQ